MYVKECYRSLHLTEGHMHCDVIVLDRNDVQSSWIHSIGNIDLECKCCALREITCESAYMSVVTNN